MSLKEPKNDNKYVVSAVLDIEKNQGDERVVVKSPSRLEVFSVSDTRDNNKSPSTNGLIKPEAKRYFILLMYAICSMEKSFQWINLSTITNKVSLYYGVDNIAVNWTSVLFMITFIPLVLPTGWLIERIGLRAAILIGSFGITLGAIIKCFSCFEDGFYVVIWGQIIVSLSEQFIFCVPARIASVWFPDHQVSLATGIGIFGNQCGIALGFLIPQALVSGLETRTEIGTGLYKLFLYTAIVSVVTLIVLVIFFSDAPKHAPGAARLRRIEEERVELANRSTFCEDMKIFGRLLLSLITNSNCTLLCVAYGVNVGTGYAIQTLLNQMIAGTGSDAQHKSTPTNADADTVSRLEAWSGDANRVVGYAGLVIIFCGMLGALFWGHLCDLTRKYMMINKILYVNAIISMCLFGVTLQLSSHAYGELILYAACALLGFHLIGYTVAGLDTAVELTYPAPELTSTSLMNLSPQIFGTAITFASSSVVDTYGNAACIVFLSAMLTFGLLVTLIIKETLNRQLAVKEQEEQTKT